MRKSRSLSALRRREPTLAPQPRILVVCEGTRTEPEYLRHFLRHHRVTSVRIKVDDGGAVPKTIVERAVRAKKEADRVGRRDASLAYDQVWCVVDVDEHPHISQAREQARANNIALAISNPCFELWFVLHFREHSRHIHRHDLQRDFKALMPGYEKSPNCDALVLLYDEAVARAKALDAWQASRSTEGENPSTSVYRLTENLRVLGRTEHLRAVCAANRARG